MAGGGGGGGNAESRSFEFTPTWVVAVVSFIIVLISLVVERSLHKLGKFFKRKKQDPLFDALEKLKEELMLLGFISLLLTVAQNVVSHICIPEDAASIMLPCKEEKITNLHKSYSVITATSWNWNGNGGRRRISAQEDKGPKHCARQGKVPLLSLEALHHLHIFIFVLAVVHVVFCVSTMLLGGAKIRQWKHWENSIRQDRTSRPHERERTMHAHHLKFIQRAGKYWRKFTIVSVIVAFFKQFYGSVTKSDYIALRSGFIRAHCPNMSDFDFHKYMLRTLEHDFKKIVGINWFLWFFVIIFLLINIAGWHTYFWLSFLPLVLLLLVGAKLEYIITKLAKKVAESVTGEGVVEAPVKPSDELFWFHNPTIVLYLIHFILFQNSFEIAFLLWVWTTYGFRSCIMEKLGFIIPRIIVGVIVQVLCSYSTFPLYALVTQMGSRFKQGMFDAQIQSYLLDWAKQGKRGDSKNSSQSASYMANVSLNSISVEEEPTSDDNVITATVTMELTHQNKPENLSS